MNHFTANSDHRYFGENRRNRYEATNNPIISTGKSDRITLEIKPSDLQIIRLTLRKNDNKKR